MIIGIFLDAPVVADDVILGTVLSIDPKENVMVVRCLGIDENSSNDIVLTVSGGISESIELGEVIRIWGSYVDSEKKKFQADRIFKGNEVDPTGVRHRLHKDRWFRREKFKGPQPKR